MVDCTMWDHRLRWGLVYLLILFTGTARAQIFKLDHPDTTSGNFFGVSVAIDGDLALVGASSENVCGENSGAAYVYQRNTATGKWAETARLSASDCKAGDFFGRTLSISGNRAIVAAAQLFFATRSSNSAYIFERDTTTGQWNEVTKLTGDPRYDEGAFATSVSLDGNRALITTSGDPTDTHKNGAAYIFERNPKTGIWKSSSRITVENTKDQGIFGGNGALRGDRFVVTASTYFDYKPGFIYIFERDIVTGTWRQIQRIGDIDDFFIPVDLDEKHILVGESRGGHSKSGNATIFARDVTGRWKEKQVFDPRVPYEFGAFGSAVALDGDRALIVGYDEQLGFSFNIDRVVYLFRYDESSKKWIQDRLFDVGEVAFGSSVALQGETAVIGQAWEKGPGAAYVVRLP